MGMGRRAIPQYGSKHFRWQVFYSTSSGGRRPRALGGLSLPRFAGGRTIRVTRGALLLLWLSLPAIPAAPDFEAGVRAYHRGDYATAIKEWLPLAPQGDPTAQFNIGILYKNGQGVSQDYATAALWYRKAAEQGYAPAQISLGGLFLAGHGVPKNPVETAKWYRKAAEQPDSEGQLKLGLLYKVGEGVPQSYPEAAKWFTAAADEGYAEAQLHLGFLYEDGKGVPQDHLMASALYLGAALEGYAPAQSRLGWLYEDGKGVPQDFEEAAKWYRMAAQQGNSYAQVSLGLLFRNGKGVPRDDSEAARWYRMAAEQGSDDAQLKLGFLYLPGEGVPRSQAEAARWFRMAAEQGDAGGQLWLATMYRDGAGVPQDDKEAARWFRMAAEQGDATAQTSLGRMYLDGRGVPQDDKEAARWFRAAADQGYAEGQFWLAAMYKDGRGVPQDYVQGHMWANLAAAQGVGEYASILTPCCGALVLAPGELEKMRRYRNSHRDQLARLMTREQLAEAQELARAWKPGKSKEMKDRPDGSNAMERRSTGTGFWISREGHVLTNHHVVDACKELFVTLAQRRLKITVMASDKGNDLAVVGPATGGGSPLTFAETTRLSLGQNVIAAGYPLHGLLASSLNLTTGIISALAGPEDDTRMIQITAPVQPGSSGGPLLDQSGNVVGVVSSSLNSLKAARLLGNVPQNVNFAIKASVARAFLDSVGVPYSIQPSVARVETTAVGERAKAGVVLLECWK